MVINTIINDIVDKLKDNITDLKVEHFPDNIDEYRLIHSKGAILVAFRGYSDSEPEELGFIQQITTIEIGINLVVTGLRDKNGAYSYIDSIRAALTGFTPTDCFKMYPVSADFLNEDAGRWEYGLIFRTTTDNFS